jgi:Carboxypeptidase regulatory-like domain/TonB dependent receptor
MAHLSSYRRRSQPFRPLALLAFIVIFTVSAFAQDASTSAIRGTVSDATGLRIAGADVVTVNLATDLHRSTVSDAEGRFALDLLPPGDYSVRVIATGMTPTTRIRQHVDVGGSLLLDFQLAVAGGRETVTVESAPGEIETQASTISSVIDERAISDLPLNGRRFTDLALLTPGVTQDPRGLTSASNGDLAFGGIRGMHSSYLVDGSDNNNAFFAQARGRYRAPYQFSNEVVQEFRVSSNSYSAELGRAGGAVINVVTRSGSNAFHGSAFYFLRDSEFGARPATLDFKPGDRQHQFGFTLGGPVRQNRVFFFAGFDQHIFHVPTVTRFINGAASVVPDPGNYPIVPPDYEATDRALVFAAAAQLSTLAGNYKSELIGNTGFLKLDFALSPKHFLSARMNTSRYYGQNNVFFDPASPLTTYAISDNGEEDVSTETGALSLTSALNLRTTSHLRVQFSRDLQESFSNSTAPLTRIYGITDGFGRSSILPRRTREHRLHVTETLSFDTTRHSLKFGGDFIPTWINNYFPSLFAGEYIFDNIHVNPFTFVPNVYGTELTPLRAFAHEVPRYYMQNFGNAVSHPDTKEYAVFAQDNLRVTSRLAVNLGVRYDLQTFSDKGLVSNPLWPNSGRVPRDSNNVAPRAGFAYQIGNDRPFVIRGGYGMFYTRIPQIYTSAIATDNGLNSTHLFLNNANFYDHQIFPSYPNALVSCALNTTSCQASAALTGKLTTEVSSFARDYQTPRVHQASFGIEHELADRFAAGVTYLYVSGENLIRARDANLPAPLAVRYPVYDPAGALLGYYNVDSFSTWQMASSFSCPFPPCINPLQRPIPQLGAVNVFETAASSAYHGVTFSVRRRMTHGLYFRLAYTYAHAIDDGQDALVVGRLSNVQNSYAPAGERASSVTDQRHRFVFSWIAAPQPFGREREWLGRVFNDWTIAGVATAGSGRPFNARMFGDPNQDDNTSNDRLPGYGRNAFVGPDYATADMRLSRTLHLGERWKLIALAESFNLLNRTNGRVDISDDGFLNSAGQFVISDKHIGYTYFPGYYNRTTDFMRPTSAYAPRQVQLALRLLF